MSLCQRGSLLSILFVLMFINGSTALGILDALPGSQFLNGLPFVSNNDHDGAATEQWPSFVRIVDVADLPSLLFPNINASSPHSPGSIWSNFFNIFTQGSEGTINDEMERENGAWFAIPGWNKVAINGTGLSHTILPGLLVPAKLEPHQMNDIANRLNNFSQIFPLGFLFNHGQDLNPFNLPFLPGKIVNPSKSEPEKTQPSLETADIKPVSENKETEVKTPNPKEARKIRAARSRWARFLNLENDGNAEAKDGDKVVNVVEPVKETGMQMEPIPTTESQPAFNSETPKTNSEDTRTLGALGFISPLLNLLSGNLGGSSSKTLTNDLQNLGTLRPPSPYNGQNGFNSQNGFTGHIDQIGQPQFFGN